MLHRLPTVQVCKMAFLQRLTQRPYGPLWRLALLVCALLAASWSQAQTPTPAHVKNVYLVGTVGQRAILVMDQNPPKTMGVGDSRSGVKVLSVGSGRADIEVNGERLQLTLGQMPMKIGVDQPALVLQSDAGGHFISKGLVNNREVTFLIDTGASVISMGADKAQELGLNYAQNGKAVKVSTANGEIDGWLLTLESVHVGQLVQHNVRAVVTPESMPYVLLGNSFLDAFHMARQANVMTIKRQP